MSLPDSHPPVHGDEACPVTGQKYAFAPPQEGDVRSVCPALNTMANHGYMCVIFVIICRIYSFDKGDNGLFSPRHGKNLSAMEMTRGLKACYGLSTFCAMFLSFGGYFMLRKFRRISLHEIGKHDAVEHNASLVHHDIPDGETYAPIEIDHSLVDALVSDVKPSAAEIEKSSDPTAKFLMNYEDVARARIRREAECKPVDALHAEIARGEMAIILGVWEVKTKSKVGIPMEYFKRWIAEERLPDGWKPDHSQGLLDVIRRSSQIRGVMNKIRKEQ